VLPSAFLKVLFSQVLSCKPAANLQWLRSTGYPRNFQTGRQLYFKAIFWLKAVLYLKAILYLKAVLYLKAIVSINISIAICSIAMTLFDDSLRCPSVMTLRDISQLYFSALFLGFI